VNRLNHNITKELNIIKESVLKTVPAEVIYLFGSYANGMPNRDSDLDIYVVVPDSVQQNPLDVGVAIRKNL
jgi:predicted nucleotidyltransferase